MLWVSEDIWRINYREDIMNRGPGINKDKKQGQHECDT